MTPSPYALLTSYRTAKKDLASASDGRDHFEMIPAELMQEVFERCFEYRGDNIPYCVGEVIDCGQYMTTKLSQVCRRWRSITFSMPHLWAYISPGNPERVKLWLQRSRNAPLYVTLGGNDSNHQAFAQSMSCIAAHANRWKAIDFDIEWFSLSELTSIFLAENQHLEQIDIRGSSLPLDDKPVFTDALFRFMSSSVHLRAIELTYLAIPTFLDAATWARLKSITFDVSSRNLTSLNDVIRCLSLCTSAESISFSSPNSLSGPDIAHGPVVLPRLSSLKLFLRGSTEKFLQYFVLPSLTKLDFSNYGAFDSNSFERFHMQSKFKLAYLGVKFEYDPQHAGAKQFLRVPWVADIGDVKIHMHSKFAEAAQVALLEDSDISARVKEKLCRRFGLIGWGKGL